MTGLLEWLLDVEQFDLTPGAPIVLRWQDALPGWAMFSLALVAITGVVMIYRRERASVPRRVTLACARCVLIALVIAVLCQPTLVLQRNREEPSHVVVLVDTSLSMDRREPYPDQDLAESIASGAGLEDVAELQSHSRLDLITRALLADDNAPVKKLLERNGLQLYTFAATAQPRAFADTQEGIESFSKAARAAVADGAGTDLAGAIRQVIERAQGRRLAAVVIATDGQSTEPTSLNEALELARSRRIPIYPLRIGSPQEPLDIDVGPLRAEETVFVSDLLAVEAQVTIRGLQGPERITVKLIDERSGLTEATQNVTLTPDRPTRTVELQTKPTQPGRVRYRVEVDTHPQEMTTQNNVDRIDIAIIDDQLKVLFVEGYPRYEYRYIKNAFLRESTMLVSVLLLDADAKFVQEGTEPIRRFPESPEELNRYDVILFGDVDPRGGWLSVAQMEMLVEFVGNTGGGFGLIAGERSAPHRFLGTPLEKLIPVRIDPEFTGRYATSLTTGFKPRLTPEGKSSRVFRFAKEQAVSEAMFENLPPLYWLARTLGPKPGASVLADHPGVQSIAGAMPVVVIGRYGAGKLFFQATDDTWRWRRHTGELLHDTYWIRVCRELMQPRRMLQDRRFAVRTDRETYRYGTPIRTHVEVFDSRLLMGQPKSLPMVVHDGEGAIIARFEAFRISPAEDVFEGTWLAPRPGRYTISAESLGVATSRNETSAMVRVQSPDLESRRPEADHAVLQRIAETSGGQVVSLSDLETVFAEIPDRSVRIPDDITEPLWDSKLVLLLFGLMISTEWVLRKAFGLL